MATAKVVQRFKGPKREARVIEMRVRGVAKSCVMVQGPDVKVPAKIRASVKPEKRQQARGCWNSADGGRAKAIAAAKKLSTVSTLPAGKRRR
jgi:hypothetical protein